LPGSLYCSCHFGLPGGSADVWTKQSLDVFTRAFVETAHDADFSSMALNRSLFEAGDVDVLVARPWYRGEDGSYDENDEIDKEEESLEEDCLGLKLVVQVSIVNPKAHPVAPASSDDGPHQRIEERVDPSSTVHRNIFQENEPMLRNMTSPFQRKHSALPLAKSRRGSKWDFGAQTIRAQTYAKNDRHRTCYQSGPISFFANLQEHLKCPRQSCLVVLDQHSNLR
jgi:hypothetical protein